MSYSGIYKVKNKSKYLGNSNNVVFRSLWERQTFIWADNSNDVVKWGSEEIIIPYFCELDKKVHRYFVDLILELKNGNKLLVEIKPKKETIPPTPTSKTSRRYLTESYKYIKNKNKWDAAEIFAQQHGFQFVKWTETELSQLGIKIITSPPRYNIRKPRIK